MDFPSGTDFRTAYLGILDNVLINRIDASILTEAHAVVFVDAPEPTHHIQVQPSGPVTLVVVLREWRPLTLLGDGWA